jgi:ABC-2 type transport system permease protein
MSRLRAIWLVARRELLERGRSKGFLAGLVLTEVFVVGSFLLQAAFAGGENVIRVGYVGDAPPALEPALHSAARQFGGSAEVVELPDRGAAEAALAGEEVDGVLIPDPTGEGAGTLLFAEDPDDRVVQTVSIALAQIRLLESGVDLSPPQVESLEPASEESASSFLLANVGVIFLFISIFSFGYWVLSGVVEEKQSRVVEVVLSTVRPRDLLMGKVFGIGILGLVQLLILLVTGLVAVTFFSDITLPEATFGAIAQLLLWFVLGYILYSTLFGVLGALASRMEEASNVTTPVSFLAMGAYFLSIFVVLNDPEGVVARVASLVPPAAPMVVPMRAALGAIEWWEIVLSVVVTVLFIYGLFVIGARVYTGAVLQTGGRMKLRDAWRASR